MFKALTFGSLASLSYLVAAAIPIGAWTIMLLTSTPENLTVSQAVLQQLKYTFCTENPARWWFTTWALAPMVFFALSASYLRGAPRPASLSLVLLMLGGFIAAASVYLWPSVSLPAALGVYWAWRAHTQIKPSASEA